MKKILFIGFVILCAPCIVHCEPSTVNLLTSLGEDYTRIGGNLHGYEFMPINDTPAPKGYVPFYISHYGRHGSRSAWGDHSYKLIINTLQHADSLGVLTPAGKELLQITQEALMAYNYMDGRLTDKGEREHARLAQRMYKRFKPVFKGKQPQVEVLSSMIQRCLVSMAAFTNNLTRQNPRIQYNFDTGEQMQPFMSGTGDESSIKDRYHATKDSLMALLPYDSTVVLNRLFTNPSIALAQTTKRLDATSGAERISIADLQRAIYDVASVAQNFDIDCNVFNYLDSATVYYYVMDLTYHIALRYANTIGTSEPCVAYAQTAVNDFITKADAAIETGKYVADLRFGHDFTLLCVASRMGINGVGDRKRPEDIESSWFVWQNICMASNLQVIFYRPSQPCIVHRQPSTDEVLVKVLYNEIERRINGLTPAQGCYYRWSDVRQLWKRE
ncbi:MAG: hypothetical protein KBS40_01230 [Bacteroidales bacterium]|nr:hypothetical protein [Bacteroidales bacterium]